VVTPCRDGITTIALHPFTLAEIEDIPFAASVFKEIQFGRQFYQDSLNTLDSFGGFPEPFTKQNNKHLRRWHNEKVERMFREDILDMQGYKGCRQYEAPRRYPAIKGRLSPVAQCHTGRP
jgi:hypothetical protein